ncbi:MAG TPA: hypothetical protein DCQ31_18590 [Bacteroidales bacterium]|nr:hypothetical protein [Bacteroidales bacterium]
MKLFISLKYKCLLTVYFSLSVCYCSQINGQIPQYDSGVFTFDSKRNSTVSFSFDLISNLIVIPVLVNNSDTMRFILDTGLKTTMITELDEQDTVDINYARQVKILGLGSGDAIDALVSNGNTIKLPGVTGNKQTLHILMQNVFNLSAKMGVRIHGIIGYDIFSQFVVKIDYANKKVYIIDPKKHKIPKKNTRSVSVIDMELNSGKPYIYSTITGESGFSHKAKILCDTGASDAIWLLDNGQTMNLVPTKKIASYLGLGLNGEITGHRGRVSSIELGNFKLKAVTASFPDSVSTNLRSLFDNRDGSMGGEIFRRFTITFDYSRNKIVLRPNRYFSDRYNYNMSGLEISKPFLHLPFYEIQAVQPESPGKEAGLQVGDQLLAINGKQTKNLNLDDINEKLIEGEGKKIKLLINRSGYIFKTVLQFKSEI